MQTSQTLFDTVGNTPLLRLTTIDKELDGIELYAKAEYFNPTGSVKDRAAKAMILDGIKRGLLTHDKTIIDATSGTPGLRMRRWERHWDIKSHYAFPQMQRRSARN